MPDTVPKLPIALQKVVDAIGSEESARRFRRLFEVGTSAMNALTDLDLTLYEEEDFELEEPLWEILAPTMRDTVNTVNELLDTIRVEFPLQANEGELKVDTAFDDMFAEEAPHDKDGFEFPWSEDGPDTLDSKVRAVTQLVQAISGRLAHEVTSFGEGIRQPSVVSDRWYLLDHIAASRGKFRAGIAEIIFQVARVFAQVGKDEVVPSYIDDIESSRLLRQHLTMLRQHCRVHHLRLQISTQGEQIRAAADKLLQTLQEFSKCPAYPYFRAADKRSFIAVRSELRSLLEQDDLDARRAARAAEGLARFLDSLATINRRELLIVSDQTTMSHAEMCLADATTQLLSDDVSVGKSSLQGGIEHCRHLFGRSEGLDDVLRLLAKLDFEVLEVADMLAVCGALQQQLSLINL